MRLLLPKRRPEYPIIGYSGKKEGFGTGKAAILHLDFGCFVGKGLFYKGLLMCDETFSNIPKAVEAFKQGERH